ncbi:transcriptional regulator, IclR family [Dethiosulfatibacter aminovorans DSM 17477]|uniref:Transcriptional regulator, IclR family n=1 Tax=Dethiosulfatibacter aminovorans DSM 17477 TaxID=1121476 RepID=A0A1M6EZB2_9FIRM|nr:IclR family transcriptional regulator [Dethiosulfatibacter aminovorans]SHI90770.1 transcriptional regulator, IclR family [Dethiosulfatibacter aminovorans DSM 17477]
MEKKLTSFGKMIEIMKAFGEEPFSYSAMELSEKLGLNRTTVHRIIAELEAEMLVVQNLTDKKYSIGPAMYHIGSRYMYRNSNFLEIRTIIDKIAMETKQNIGYTVIDNGKIINLYESEITMPMRITYRHGSYFPINCGAYGKTITAYHEPMEELEKVVREADLEKRTPNTIVDPDKLLEEYEKIRKNGFAISDEENMIGAFGIGAPIFNSSGKIHGCVGLAAVKTSINEEDISRLIEIIKKGAKDISKFVV